MGQRTGPLPLPILCWQLAAAALLRAGGSLPLHPQYRDECAVAVGGGTPVQRASLDPADKEAVHAQLCSAELCAEEARAAYGARAWDLLCAGPPSVVDPVHGGLWGLAQPKTHWTSELGIASNAGNDTLGCFGGIGLVGLTVSSAEVFSVPNNEWTATADVPLPTNHPMPAATQDGRMFLAGGGLFPLGQPDRDTLFEYQAGTDAWAQRANMPTSRAAGAATELGGLLYFGGGWPPHGADFASYNPADDSWRTLAPLNHQRNHLVLVAVPEAGLIVAVGGRTTTGLTGTRVVEIYDPATDTWRDGAEMPPPAEPAAADGAYSGHNGVAAQGCVHVFGGEWSGGVFPEHHVYDVFTDEWRRLADMPVPVHGMVGMHVDRGGWIHFAGGATEPAIGGMSRIHQVYHPGTLRCEAAEAEAEAGGRASI